MLMKLLKLYGQSRLIHFQFFPKSWGKILRKVRWSLIRLNLYFMTKTNGALGVDIGNVIINHRLTDKDDKTLHEERYSTIPRRRRSIRCS